MLFSLFPPVGRRLYFRLSTLCSIESSLTCCIAAAKESSGRCEIMQTSHMRSGAAAAAAAASSFFRLFRLKVSPRENCAPTEARPFERFRTVQRTSKVQTPSSSKNRLMTDIFGCICAQHCCKFGPVSLSTIWCVPPGGNSYKQGHINQFDTNVDQTASYSLWLHHVPRCSRSRAAHPKKHGRRRCSPHCY